MPTGFVVCKRNRFRFDGFPFSKYVSLGLKVPIGDVFSLFVIFCEGEEKVKGVWGSLNSDFALLHESLLPSRTYG